MEVTNTFKVLKICPCNLKNGNYSRDLKKDLNNISSDTNTKKFCEIFEDEKLKLNNKV